MTLTRRQLVLLAALTLMWGLNWPMMKFSLREISPLHFRAITMSGGTLTLLLFFALRGVDLRLSRTNAWHVGVLTLPNIVGWHLCSIMMRMMFDGFIGRTASLGSPGVNELRWMAPLRPVTSVL